MLVAYNMVSGKIHVATICPERIVAPMLLYAFPSRYLSDHVIHTFANNLFRCFFHFFSEAWYTLAPAGGWLLSIFRLFFITYCKYLRFNIRFGFDTALLSRQLVRTQPS